MSSDPGIETRFIVDAVTHTRGKSEQIKMSAVQHSDAKPENRVFTELTPNGLIDFTINNPNAKDLFEPGAEYRVTFYKVSEPAEA